MRRRAFMRTVFTPGLGLPVWDATARTSPPGAGVRLGFDTYSIRAFGWRGTQLLDYAARLQLDTLQISDLTDYGSLEPADLQKVRDHAARLGLSIDGGLGCICPSSSNWNPKHGDPVEYVRRGLRAAGAVGATCMRCFMGAGADRRGPVPLDKHIETTIKILRSVRSQALDLNVKIAVENHLDLQAWELRSLIEEAGKDFVGACLDSGNPIAVVEDPMVALETLGPYVVTTHIKDAVVFEHPRGAATQSVALGDGSINFPRFFELFRQICPSAAAQLEVTTGGPPRVLPYLEPDFWTAFPKARASQFARFVALARNGRPFMGSMIVAGPGKAPPEYEAALKEQQRVDLERSLEYARKVLKLGLRGQGRVQPAAAWGKEGEPYERHAT